MRWLLLAMVALAACGCTRSGEEADPGPGISRRLAAARAAAVGGLRYHLAFSIPASPEEPVSGRAVLHLDLRDASRPLVLDFRAGADALLSVSSNGKASRFRAVPDHIVIPAGELRSGENRVELAFRAGDAPLNRGPDYLYSLFVPARAHLAFPCLDQPDLKAAFTLELEIPTGWEALANGRETSRRKEGDRVRIRFAETAPISTYLFAFAAGRFEVEEALRGGRAYRLFHRETDAAKVARNQGALFDLHHAALRWMENYTGIPYPFGKFDFIAIPSFQFGGMEHPGAIYYNAASVLLDESATEAQILGRASTVAHETSHMWFGDLVTMRWFDDVWMKEVFANFMAAKIVNPSFPAVNHDLRFLVAHYPSAYSVDRTAGTHAIRQELENLDEAGSLYGPIIYAKAPIVMRHLERILGPEHLREGLQTYLRRHSFGSASWLDLVRILDEQTPRDLAAWSRAWVEDSGRPRIRTEREGDRAALVQSDPRWVQHLEVLVGAGEGLRTLPVELAGSRLDLGPIPGLRFVLPAGGGVAYGDFVLDAESRRHLLARLPELGDPVARGAAWITLWEEMLGSRVEPADFMRLALQALPREETEQNVQLLLGYLETLWWRFLPGPARAQAAAGMEGALRAGLQRAPSSTMKSTYWSAFRSMVATAEGVAYLERVWRRQEKIPGLNLSEPDEATMALELAVRSVPAWEGVLREQHGRFSNPDRRARFAFVMPALSGHSEARGAFFRSLENVENRRREPWVLEGLYYLNHPLRAPEAESYMEPGLELLAEIQRTGDIFFPRRWLDSLLWGHSSPRAAAVVREFLERRRDYPPRLGRILLQAADPLFRAQQLREAFNRHGQ